MTPSRNTRIVLRVALYGCAVACIIWIVAISRSPRGVQQRAKVTICRVEMANVVAAITDYESVYGLVPSGDAVALISALRGQNPKRTAFLKLNEHSLNPNG